MTPTPTTQREPDPCLTRLCDTCGKRIQGGYGYCPKCNICVCFSCEVMRVIKKGEYPSKCPMCGAKLEDSLFPLIDVTRKILDDPDPHHGR